MQFKKIFNTVKQDKFWIILLASSFAIITAYFAEFIAKIMPCSLCILQRIPYFVLILLSIISLLKPKSQKLISILIIFACITEIMLAIYHIGIEHYIFEESSVCQIITNTKVASSCSQVNVKFMNFSMAEWNLIYISGILYYFIKAKKSL